MSTDIDGLEDYYAALGVSPSATDEEIKRAYRKLARRYHPDSRTEQAPTTLFHGIQAAYGVLSDPKLRHAYDQQRLEAGMSEEAALAWRIQLSHTRLSSLHQEQMIYVLAEIWPAATARGERLPLNLSLVIDRSTSMQGARLEQVKQAAYHIIDELDEGDSLAVIAFNDRPEVVLPATMGVNRIRAKARVASIFASGGTEIFQGLEAGITEVDKYLGQRMTNHVILLTDGQTYGDEEDCLAAARLAGARRIGISAMGIGKDWNDTLLDEMASQSGGVSAYIASPGQVRTLLQQRVRGLGSMFAQGLALEYRCADGVHLENMFRTSPYVEYLKLTGDPVNLGTLQADSSLTMVIEVSVPQMTAGEHRLIQFELTGDVPSLGRLGERLRHDITCTFTADELPPEPVPPAILSVLSKVTIFRMQEQAWTALDDGNVKRATRQLERIATRLFELGDTQLARAAMLEAGRISHAGTATAKGRKEIKYGTRSLAIPTRRESYD